MKSIAHAIAAAFAVLFTGAVALIAFVAIAAGGAGSVTAALAVSNPSPEAIEDIPSVMLSLFIDEAQQCPGLPWTVMAGISKVESDHGRFGGAVLTFDGTVQPPIIGIPLNGTNGTAQIPDTDQGRWDGDTVWDRAIGPFQFIPSSWRLFGTDGNSDNIADPHNVFDAIGAMRQHLCPDGQVVDIESAVFAYNHSNVYVAKVLEWAAAYTGPLTVAATPVAGYALPVPPSSVSEAMLIRSHHTYPATDLAVPAGTAVYAMVAGTITATNIAGVFPDDPNRCGTTIILAGVDGATYTYCHLSRLTIASGQVVAPGTLVGLSGGKPGAPGAGRTTGAHLHIAIRVAGDAICPQPLLLAIARETPLNPTIAPSAGCVTGRPATDWQQWLDQLEFTPPTGG